MQPGSCFCCCRLLLLLLVLPGARSHLAGTGETSGLPTSPQAGCRQQRGDSSRILMKLTQLDHRGANQLISNHSARCERQDSVTETPAALLRPGPVLSRAPASCFARCCAPTLKSRRNPVRRSAEGVTRGRGGGRKVLSPLDRTPVVVVAYSHRRTETSLPGLPESTSQVKVNQRNWTNRVDCACVQTQRRTNFCRSDRPRPTHHRPLSATGHTSLQQVISGSQGGVRGASRVVTRFPGGPNIMMIYCMSLYLSAL